MVPARSALGAACLASMLLGCSQLDPEPKQSYPTIQVASAPAQNLDQACVANFQPGLDYLPDKTEFHYSNQLSVSYHGHYKQVTFRPSVSAEEPVEMLFVQCGTPVPEHGSRTIVVSVPVSRIVTGTRAMLGAADDLGVVDRFVGISDPRAITVPSFVKRVEQGQLSMMSGYAHGNIEPLMALDPDVYFTFHSAYPQFNMHPRLWALGIRAVPHGDILESTPLGRAEWMKVLAMLTNTEARANVIFDRVERQYRSIADLVPHDKTPPRVMAGTASQRDVIELFGGRNQRAQMLRDAGARYVLDDDRFPGSWLTTSFERVYAAGADAPFWIGTRPGIQTIDALIAANPHHRWFEAAVGGGNVYALDQGYKGMFAYHFEDQSLNNPHVVLAEIVAVLHPGLRARIQSISAVSFIRKLQ